MIKIFNLLNQSNKKQINNFNVCYTKKPISPFSFLNFVFINTNNLELNQIDKILLHESVHVRQKHSFDLILLELISILQWFNPIIYLYKHSVKTIHEYLSDEKVLAQGYDSDDYKLLLLQQKIGIQPGFVSNLNKSLTLKRIIMMNQKKSKDVAKFKVLLLVPAILLSIILFSCQKENLQSPKAPTQNSLSDGANLPSPPPPPSSSTDKMPEFPGGEAALTAFLQKNVVYPPEAIKNNYQGIVFVRFLVDKEGKVKDPKIIRGENEILNKEALRVIGLLPKFKPATKDGSPVGVYFTLPITFKLNN